MSRVRGSLNATITGKPDQVCCAIGAYRIRCIWGKTAFSGIHLSCVQVFKSTFRAMRFQDLHGLQKLGSCEASFGAKVV